MAKFEQGKSGNPGGRPKGANKTTIEARALCQRMVGDSQYRQKLQERLLRGKLAPAVECMMWYFAFGKPRDTLNLEGHVQVDETAAREAIRLKLDQLAERLRQSPEAETAT